MQLVVLLSCAGQGNSIEIDSFSFTAGVSYAVGTRNHENQRSRLEFAPQLDLALSRVDRFRASLRMRYDGSYPIGDDSLNTYYSSISELWRIEEHGSLELRDFYWERPLGTAFMRVGKQQIVWGALDGIKLLDVINPQSLQDFILDEFSESRISLWSALFDIPLGPIRLELAWVPDNTSHELPAAGSSFSFVAPRFRFGFPRYADTESVMPVTERDDHPWDGQTVGARASVFASGWDIAISAVSGNDPLPVGSLQQLDGEPRLVSQYKHRDIYGVSLQKSFSAFAFRTEAALRRGRAFNALASSMNPSTLRIVDKDQLGVAVALDWNAPADIFVNLQLFYDEVIDAPNDLVRPAYETLSTLFLRRMFLYDTLAAELRWYSVMGRRDELFRAALSYAVADDTSIRGGVDLFYGSQDGIFGQYEDSSRFVLSLEKTF